MSQARALIVEDDIAIRELLQLHLSRGGFDIAELGDGRQAVDVCRSTGFDLIVLDVMLPGCDGVTVCRTIRNDTINAKSAILMLTARDSESDKVLGLESGADDYLTKPFGIRELMARVGAILRRSRRTSDTVNGRNSPVVKSRDVTVDTDKRQVIVRGDAMDLTRQEFDLLHLFVSHPGIVFSRAALIARLWGGDTYVTERTVDAVVSRLRRKIERDAQDPELILTAWGVGYKFVDVE